MCIRRSTRVRRCRSTITCPRERATSSRDSRRSRTSLPEQSWWPPSQRRPRNSRRRVRTQTQTQSDCGRRPVSAKEGPARLCPRPTSKIAAARHLPRTLRLEGAAQAGRAVAAPAAGAERSSSSGQQQRPHLSTVPPSPRSSTSLSLLTRSVWGNEHRVLTTRRMLLLCTLTHLHLCTLRPMADHHCRLQSKSCSIASESAHIHGRKRRRGGHCGVAKETS